MGCQSGFVTDGPSDFSLGPGSSPKRGGGVGVVGDGISLGLCGPMR